MRRLCVVLAIGLLSLTNIAPAAAVDARPGIVTTTVASGFTYPTAVEVLPDGRMLVADKQGELWLVVNGQTRPTPVIDLRDRVSDYWDRGMVALAVDPNFATDGYLYLYYSMENGTGDAGTKASRLSRFTMVGETANPNTEFIVLGSANPSACPSQPASPDCIPDDFYGHIGGGLEFATDGTLFVSIGDSSSWDVVDDHALRAQDIDSYSGKVLHITAQGAGISTNPFWSGNASDIRSKVWAYGFRNPFRLTLQPGTGTPYVGDVGWGDWEEVDKVTAGANYGWPCYEGIGQQSGYAPKSICQTLYGQGTGAVKPPLMTYPHTAGSSSITGGVFLRGSSFPALYQNAYVFGDYARNYIHYLDLNANGDLGPGGSEQGFATAADGPVDFKVGPDGALYYVAILSGEVRRMSYQASGGATYVSDLPFTGSSNGSGPPERDYSVGGSEAGDGGPITLDGVQYAKGVGVASPSQIDFQVPAGCTSFTAVVGIDDDVSNAGSVNFVVSNGSTNLWQSPVITGASAAQTVTVPLAGVSALRLAVSDGGDGTNLDHADWADAKLVCGNDTTPPTLISFSPTDGATGIAVAVTPVARFSEPLDPASVNTTSVALTAQPSGTPVAGSVTYNDVARSVTFTPSAPLATQAQYRLTVSGVTDVAGNRLSGNGSATFTTGAAGVQTRYLSDMVWVASTNGWGPAERDKSNNEQGATDGRTLSVAGATYAKGVGAHAIGTITLDLSNQNCTRFQSVIGIDDEVANQGSVRFQVWNGTTTMLSQSSVLTGSSPVATVDLDITGINNIRLVVTDNGDGNSFDHADWADAKFTCNAATGGPSVFIDTPASGAQYAVGDTVSFTGHATASNGSAIPAAQLQWDVQIRHCPQGNCHLHPVTQLTGTGGSITFPDHGDDSHIDIKLTATDGAGRSSSLLRTVEPRLVNLNLASSPSGRTLVYNGETVTAPATRQVTVGGTRTISATNGGGYIFQSWSDGGAAQHNVTLGATAMTVTATFTQGSGGAQSLYVSDMTWGTATNGWGPPERDRSNNQQGATDGGPITVAGTTYPKGVGAHANSSIPIDLTGLGCTRFQSVVGIDDEVANQGSVRFQVWNGTTTMLTQSAALTGASATATIDIDITAITSLRLVITDNADGNSYDHADWADAKLTCATTTDSTPPTVTSMSPVDASTNVGVTVAPVALFSEPLDPATVSSATVKFTIQPAGTAVTGTASYDNTARSITFTPSAALSASTSYRFQVIGGASGVADPSGNRLAANATTTFTTAAAGAQLRYVSDLTWGTVTNGWGPPERDRSNNQQGATDGGPITVAGTTYPKGVGAHANSTIPLDLTGMACTRFQSVVGIDDEVANQGSVRFQVWNGTTTMLTQSAALTGASAAATIDIDISGVTSLRLVITDNADGNSYDHADWADAKLTCATTTDSTPPTVTSMSPVDASTNVGVTVAPVALFSEPLDPATVSSATVKFTIQPAGTAVTGTASYDNTARSITFTPSAALSASTSYRFQVIGGASGVADPSGNRLAANATTTFTTAAAGAQLRYVSDLTWGTVTNGWGPPERDRSNNQQGATDGGPITVAGTTYPKGVGAHANSTIPLDLTGMACTRFQSVVGIDDEVANQGSVRFQVWNGTTTMLTQSAALTGASAAATIDIDITAITSLRLVITDNADGNSYDHADWADAKLTCTS